MWAYARWGLESNHDISVQWQGSVCALLDVSRFCADHFFSVQKKCKFFLLADSRRLPVAPLPVPTIRYSSEKHFRNLAERYTALNTSIVLGRS